MVIINSCLLLEVLTIVICLHHLYGEKFKLDIVTVSFLSADMIIMTMINFFGMARIYTMIVYPVIILYCGIRFGFKLKKIVVNIVLCITLVGVIQMFGLLFIHSLYNVQAFSDYKLIFANGITFFIVLILFPVVKVDKLSKFSQDNSKIIILVISVCVAWILFWMFSYKKLMAMDLHQAIMLFVSIVLILILVGQLNKYKIKAKEIETELKMHELYSEPFQGLIDNIRLKQHEFDNHLNAIYSLHLTCHTYEELVEAQNNYCKQLIKENCFNKLLATDNAVIRAFLYTRFVEISKIGIEVSYRVVLSTLNIGVPAYKIIEILGNLINNSVEALETEKERKKLHVEIVEIEKFFIEVRNESPYISYDMLGNFFNKGYSKKGENRGIGLYNIKQICEEYGMEIASKNIEIDGSNWLSFLITLQQKKIS